MASRASDEKHLFSFGSLIFGDNCQRLLDKNFEMQLLQLPLDIIISNGTAIRYNFSLALLRAVPKEKPLSVVLLTCKVAWLAYIFHVFTFLCVSNVGLLGKIKGPKRSFHLGIRSILKSCHGLTNKRLFTK